KFLPQTPQVIVPAIIPENSVIVFLFYKITFF
ncbi:MAG: hypothetical protein ACI87X_001218, partial [Candidatus Arcticimaribacter sp.]